MLHGLGLNYVRERIIRRHYGTVKNKLFDEEHDPPHLQYLALDGRTKCRGVMDWFASKVLCIETDTEDRERAFLMEPQLISHFITQRKNLIINARHIHFLFHSMRAMMMFHQNIDMLLVSLY